MTPANNASVIGILREILCISFVHMQSTVLNAACSRIEEEVAKRSNERRYLYSDHFQYHKSKKDIHRTLKIPENGIALASKSSQNDKLHDVEHKYSLIGIGFFRCLDLAPGEREEPLRGSLISLPCDENVQYEAISYRWGHVKYTEIISCNDSALYVTRTVADVLRRLRLPNMHRRLWIDSICIDQSSIDDKGSQVSNMDWIYKNALRTFLWFGEEDDATGPAFSILHALHEVNTKFSSQHGRAARPSIADLSYYGMPGPDDSRWAALTAFLHNEWFSRTWVLQEVTLAKNAWIWNGRYHFAWHDLEWIIYNMLDSSMSQRLSLPLNRAHLVAQVHVQCLRSQGATLLNLLYMSILTETTVPKDKVFALLGISSDSESLRKSLSYRQSDLETFSKVAIYYLQKGNLDILNVCSDPSLRNLKHLPSWVPDWSSNAPPLDLIGSLQRITGLSPGFTPLTARKRPQARESDRELVVYGAVLGKIVAIGQHTSPLKPALHFMDTKRAGRHLEQWRKIAMRLRSYPTGESVEKAFARTLVLGATCIDVQESAYYGFYTTWVSQLLGRGSSSTDSNSRESGLFSRYTDHAAAACRKRTFYITDDGYMGLGPYFLRPGDYIAHLDGGATPYVIRKSREGSFVFVGDIYVHGLMDLKLEDSHLEEIVLV